MENLINKVFKQNCGDSIFVLEKTNTKAKNGNYFYKCRFLEYPCEVLALKQNILEGRVANLLYPSLFGIAYLGIGKYNRKNYKCIYNNWYSILNRCYNISCTNYIRYGARNITICDSWLNFQNFAAWYEENSKWNIFGYKLELDKDILFNIYHSENKIYSPSTCLLIPSELNCFLAGDNLGCGVFLKSNNKYQVEIKYNKKLEYLGVFNNFKEAKQIYSNKKYEFWIQEIEKFDLPNNLREILLKYDFSWYWNYEKNIL